MLPSMMPLGDTVQKLKTLWTNIFLVCLLLFNFWKIMYLLFFIVPTHALHYALKH